MKEPLAVFILIALIIIAIIYFFVTVYPFRNGEAPNFIGNSPSIQGTYSN